MSIYYQVVLTQLTQIILFIKMPNDINAGLLNRTDSPVADALNQIGANPSTAAMVSPFPHLNTLRASDHAIRITQFLIRYHHQTN